MARIKYEVQTTVYDHLAQNEEHKETLRSWRFKSDTALAEAIKSWAQYADGDAFVVTIRKVA
jgi:hypothetical protein